MLKGKATIELTDVNTGEVERYEEENLVTTAMDRLLGDNICGSNFNVQGTSGERWMDYNLPLCPNAIGGILLYSDPIEEDENLLYAPTTNPCVGYASNDVNATANSMRGSMNQEESKPVAGGYKFVFDFATNQGNGSISAIALTHKKGGIGYYGDMYNKATQVFRYKNMQSGTVNRDLAMLFYYCIEIDFERNVFYSIEHCLDNTIRIRTVKKSFTNLFVRATLQPASHEGVVDERILSPSIFIDNRDTNYRYSHFDDGKDGYWYGFNWYGNDRGDATIKWIKINKKTYEFTEGTWNLSNIQLWKLGEYYVYNNTTDAFRNIYCTVNNGYLYCMKYDKTGVYKININNVADIKYIPLGFTASFGTASNYCQIYMWKINDVVCTSNFIITADDTVIKTTNNNPLDYTLTPIFQYGVYGITFGRYTWSYTYIYENYYIIPMFLATINNLSAAVIKTADKTMKITYTITEEEPMEEAQ